MNDQMRIVTFSVKEFIECLKEDTECKSVSKLTLFNCLNLEQVYNSAFNRRDLEPAHQWIFQGTFTVLQLALQIWATHSLKKGADNYKRVLGGLSLLKAYLEEENERETLMQMSRCLLQFDEILEELIGEPTYLRAGEVVN